MIITVDGSVNLMSLLTQEQRLEIQEQRSSARFVSFAFQNRSDNNVEICVCKNAFTFGEGVRISPNEKVSIDIYNEENVWFNSQAESKLSFFYV